MSVRVQAERTAERQLRTAMEEEGGGGGGGGESAR